MTAYGEKQLNQILLADGIMEMLFLLTLKKKKT